MSRATADPRPGPGSTPLPQHEGRARQPLSAFERREASLPRSKHLPGGLGWVMFPVVVAGLRLVPCQLGPSGPTQKWELEAGGEGGGLKSHPNRRAEAVRQRLTQGKPGDWGPQTGTGGWERAANEPRAGHRTLGPGPVILRRTDGFSLSLSPHLQPRTASAGSQRAPGALASQAWEPVLPTLWLVRVPGLRRAPCSTARD